MDVVESKGRIPIRLTQERWSHTIETHPEMAGIKELVLETVSEPEVIQRGDAAELIAARSYTDTPRGEKWVVVTYRETSASDGFIITAHLARRLSSQKEELWRRY